MQLITHLIFGITACFIGALPLGAINMSVVSISIRKSHQQAIYFALGASIVEIMQAGVAVVFGFYINQYINNHTEISYLIATLFLALGVYFFAKTPSVKCSEPKDSTKPGKKFYHGLAVALLNPQAIPFWLFILAFVAPLGIFRFSGISLLLFLLGVFIGKITALIGFAKLSKYLEQSVIKNNNALDYIMGTVFFSLGIIQLFTHLQ